MSPEDIQKMVESTGKADPNLKDVGETTDQVANMAAEIR